MKIASVAVAVLLLAGSLTGCSQSVQATVFDCKQYVQTPKDFTPYCADAGQNFSKVSWSYWGGDFANGTGKAITNLCQPNCAAGRLDVTDADLTLDKPVKLGSKKVFTELVIKYHDSVAGHPLIEKLSLGTKPLGK